MKVTRMTRRRGAQRQNLPAHHRGVASLVVVMLLLFVVALSAAYASRNLIFEQKTSANQARSTLAFEAAEAGVEWTLAQLNGGQVSTTCANSTTAGSFQQRYLSVSATGMVTPRDRSTTSTAGNWWPTCVFNGTGWTCACPADTADSPTPLPSGAGPFPAFRIWLGTPEPTPTPPAVTSPWTAMTPPSPAGLVAISSTGCTRLATGASDDCLSFQPIGEMGEGLATVRVLLGLRSGLSTPPSAAITARLGLDLDTTPGRPKLRAVNTDPTAGGFTVYTGAAISALQEAQLSPDTLPGTPGVASLLRSDPKLAALSTVAAGAGALTDGERMFVSTFGMKRNTYRQQPGLRIRNAETIPDLLANNPRRVIWVDGDLTLSTDVGTAADPVLLIVNGDRLTLSAGVTITGFVYLRGSVPSPAGTPCTVATCVATVALPDALTHIKGALVTEGVLKTTYAGTPAATSELVVTYQRNVLDLIRHNYGSWVRVGGGWRDFKGTP